MLYNNVIKSYQVKDLGKKKVIGFEDDLDFIKSPDRKGSLKTEIERYSEKLEELEKEFEERRKELVLLNEEIENKRREAEVQSQKYLKENEKKARTESQNIMQQAREQGKKEGIELGIQQLKTSYSEFIGYLENLKTGLVDEVKQNDRKYKDQVVNLLFSILKKILHEPELSGTLKKNAIRNFEDLYREIEKNIKYSIYVSKEDYDMMNSYINKLYEGYKPELIPELFPSDKISAGGCIIETQFGTLDASLESQLGDIYKEFIRLSKEDVSSLS